MGRPKKILSGNIDKCFVKPHLHILISGNHKAFISNLIINYFKKRYTSIKNNNRKVRIWKRYILITDTERVRKYIEIQSLHYLTVSVNKRGSKIETKSKIKKRTINVRAKNQTHINKNTVSQDNYNQNYILLCNLRNQWLVLEQLKKIADYIVNYALYDALVVLQDRIKNYGNMINADIDVAHLYNNDIINITMEIEKLRQITVSEKQKFDYFVVQPIYS